jgi:DNA-binding MarR family transcriptional regulator
MDATTLAELRHLILAAQRHGSRMLAGHLREASLTPSQSEVLEVLADHAPLTLVELGRLLICETGSPSRLVDTLVQRGLITREPGHHDKRVVRLRLTPAGERVLADGQATTSAVEDFIADRLTPNEMTQLATLLRKLLHDTPGGHAIQTRYRRDRPLKKMTPPQTAEIKDT